MLPFANVLWFVRAGSRLFSGFLDTGTHSLSSAAGSRHSPPSAQMVQARSSRAGRPWGGRWLGLGHLLVKCALARLAAKTKTSGDSKHWRSKERGSSLNAATASCFEPRVSRALCLYGGRWVFGVYVWLGGTLRASDRGRNALPTCIRKPQTPKPSCLPSCCLLPVVIMDWTVSIHLAYA